jgi:hypothetical protein
MSGPGNIENIIEIVEPILEYVDGIIWVLNDCPVDDPGARYLETVKGGGKIIHRSFVPRHWHLMNETLFTGLIDEGDLVCWIDPLERAQLPFLKKVKTEIDHFMKETGVDCLFYYGKAYLFRYYETLQYHNTPHWVLSGYPGKAIEWSNIEPNEDLVRKNMRPIKRTDPYHWVGHYMRYFLFPAGSNSALLGLDQWPGGETQQNFVKRETQRLEFRRLVKKRGFPLTLDGVRKMLSGEVDEEIKSHLRAAKTLSDFHHHIHGRSAELKHSHNPADALPIE